MWWTLLFLFFLDETRNLQANALIKMSSKKIKIANQNLLGWFIPNELFICHENKILFSKSVRNYISLLKSVINAKVCVCLQ